MNTTELTDDEINEIVNELKYTTSMHDDFCNDWGDAGYLLEEMKHDSGYLVQLGSDDAGWALTFIDRETDEVILCVCAEYACRAIAEAYIQYKEQVK